MNADKGKGRHIDHIACDPSRVLCFTLLKPRCCNCFRYAFRFTVAFPPPCVRNNRGIHNWVEVKFFALLVDVPNSESFLLTQNSLDDATVSWRATITVFIDEY
jgi:hypothetical protein